MQQNNFSEIIIAKFNYKAQENHELSITKNERLVLIDETYHWWKVKRVDSDDTGYIPSNFARREKRSLLDKIISKRFTKKTNNNQRNSSPDRIISLALVKYRYDAESEDEISLDKGIWINVLQKKNDGWWFVQHEKQCGWFPSNYLIEKTSESLNSLSLLNIENNSPSSSLSNGLSSSSSANSNLIDNQNFQQIRHNSNPLNKTNSTDEYSFVLKSSKFAHSDERLDSPMTSIVEKFQTLKLNNSPYFNKIWYFGLLSREDAEKYLKLYGNEKGDFLIRDSERRIGNYSLSIRENVETIRHFRIQLSDDGQRYLIGKRSFQTLDELVEHYKIHPVHDVDLNNKLYLNEPLIISN